MAIKEVKRYWESCQLDYVKEFLCHTEKDVANLPACCVGSTAHVAETGNVYVCGSDKTWKREEEALGKGGSGLPTGGEPYKQLVTDGEGNAVWEDRLGWKEAGEITWDGDLNAAVICVGNSATGYYVKVSDKMLTDEQIKSGMFTFTGETTGAQTYDFDGLQSNFRYVHTSECSYFENTLVVVRVADMAISNVLVFPETGTYFYTDYMNAGWLSSIAWQVAHPILAEYITGAPLTDADNGKMVGVVEGALGLVDAPGGGNLSLKTYYASASGGQLYTDKNQTVEATVADIDTAKSTSFIIIVAGASVFYPTKIDTDVEINEASVKCGDTAFYAGE